MARFALRRAVDLVVTVAGVMTIVFVMLRLSGDPLGLVAPQDASAEELNELRHAFGFDQPLWTQYAQFLARAVQGDLGQSLQFRRPAVELVLDTLPMTLLLTAAAIALSAAIAIPAGTLAAFRRGRPADRAIMTGTLVGQSIPYFWLGIMLIMLFAVRLGWLPTSGSGSLAHLILPALTLSATSMARTARLVRAEMLGVLRQDYIRTALAKGLTTRAMLFRHALRNAMLPAMTTLALDTGILLGGAVVTETIFAWPGLGRLIVQGILLRDFPVVQAGVLYLSITFVLINGSVDGLYAILDPRIRKAA
ncbi:MAG: ABC transporter permease [Candidatus Rokubacteria bacterium]|nr:ABC transporter permease [Candidatus Rokubacteria bacterium]MBI2158482.1 ABC transporter permease [Candidatus Rokubacteria bacterium]MBI2490907.1 ABC transporter permease [Candidatus Rokubacteria bacterium]MBI4253553.1 ABC transporter permease [Candidatus Rokubacteria bacterium]MBI4629535.1 ABC transporter permease [Candidatus Rokubacteria bacterium]